MTCAARTLLNDARERHGSLLSIGLEPAPDYLPERFADDPEGFLRLVIEAGTGRCCAFKFNTAFFESMGPDGWALLHRVREAIPEEHLVIADAKRGDIGTTAKHYASSLYDVLGAHSATVNPLMGRDSAQPFLDHTDRLTFFLGLTSNPGADDFLTPHDLHLRIARAVEGWNTAHNCGLVVGATRPEGVRSMREAAPSVPLLVPGVGAQGGDLAGVLGETSDVLLHVTRGVLPDPGADPLASMIEKIDAWNSRISDAGAAVGGAS
ncbi:MAG: orotidine-5'-phosphate decarboxylase [Phycisphaerales bacterium]